MYNVQSTVSKWLYSSTQRIQLTSPALLVALSPEAPSFDVRSINRLSAVPSSASVFPNEELIGPSPPPLLNERLYLLGTVTCKSKEAKTAQYRYKVHVSHLGEYRKKGGRNGQILKNKRVTIQR